MTDINERLVSEALKTIITQVESESSHDVAEAMHNVLRHTHRTHQQSFMGCLSRLLRLYGEGDSDLRNRASVQWALRAAELAKDGFPFI